MPTCNVTIPVHRRIRTMAMPENKGCQNNGGHCRLNCPDVVLSLNSVGSVVRAVWGLDFVGSLAHLTRCVPGHSTAQWIDGCHGGNAPHGQRESGVVGWCGVPL